LTERDSRKTAYDSNLRFCFMKLSLNMRSRNTISMHEQWDIEFQHQSIYHSSVNKIYHNSAVPVKLVPNYFFNQNKKLI